MRGAVWIVVVASACASPKATGEIEGVARPGQMIDVGGHRLHVSCVGSGAPTLVLEAGAGACSVDWALVHERLGRVTRTCVYDRAGMGWSEAGPFPRRGERIADELDVALERAGERGPLVLVGHSFGGVYVRIFRQRHPERVVGMALIAPSHEDMMMSVGSPGRGVRLVRMREWADETAWNTLFPPAVTAINGNDIDAPEGLPPLEGATIRVAFAEPIDAGTIAIAPGSIELVDRRSGAAVAATVTAEVAGAIIRPAGELIAGGEYELRLGERIRDGSGDTLKPTAIKFVRGPAPWTPAKVELRLPDAFRALPLRLQRVRAAARLQPRSRRTNYDAREQMRHDLQYLFTARRAPPLGELPVLVILTPAEDDPDLSPDQQQELRDNQRAWRADLGRLSSRARVVNVDTGHFVQLDRPDTVVEEIAQLVHDVRAIRGK